MALKEIIKRKGISQKQLAQKLGVLPSAVSMWVTGERVPRTKYLLALANELGCTIEELLGSNKEAS